MFRRLFLTLPFATPALAQTGHSHSHGAGPNGGVVAEIGNQHLELVLRDGELRIYLLNDQDQPMPATGVAGTAVLQSQGRQQSLRLAAGPGNAYLVGQGEFAARGTRVVASLTLPGQPQRSVRFPVAP